MLTGLRHEGTVQQDDPILTALYVMVIRVSRDVEW